MVRFRFTNFLKVGFFFSLLLFQFCAWSQNPWVKLSNRPSVLSLEEDRIHFETKEFIVELVKSSQTIAALRPKSHPDFDFTPGDSLKVRSSNGFYHLGDINLRLRLQGNENWKSYSTAKDRHPVKSLQVSGFQQAAADLTPSFSSDIPLNITRYWETINGQLVLTFRLRNISDKKVEVGALGVPMIFNNILSGSLDQAHANNVFYDPYMGLNAGYLQVTRLTGKAPTMLVLPLNKQTPFEAYNPLLDDPTPRGITFEGFYEWVVAGKAFAEEEWKNADLWNVPASFFLNPGEERKIGFRFVLSGKPAQVGQILIENNMPVAVGIPGYILPLDVDAKLFLEYTSKVKSVTCSPEGLIAIKRTKNKKQKNLTTYNLHGKKIGRGVITIRYEDGVEQAIQYKVIKSEKDVVTDYGNFLYEKQWFEPSSDTFHRSPSIISYDNELKQQVTQENRAWIAGLSDEAGAGSWLGAAMKQFVIPDKTQVAKLEQFVDKTLWGQIQYSTGDLKYGVKKSLFYYEPDKMPLGTYDKNINFKTWSAWPLKEAMSPGRSYNYPHVTAAWWIKYRLARFYTGLLSGDDWSSYLSNACQTALAMVKLAPYYAQFGQMEGTIFYLVLRDLKEEGMTDLADQLESEMKKRTLHWSTLNFPFGSEMPWDSTGQEEVYVWSKYFGFDDKADITLNAILAYMPAIPGWAYNGNARRYWDFQYAGKLMRIERMIHHYGSALNAIPVLQAYRANPDFHLLKAGYGGYLGAIANIESDGFAPVAFHAFPSTLKNDAYTGDYGSGFFGYAVNSATYLVDHEKYGWLAFGGNVVQKKNQVMLVPTTSGRSSVFIGSESLWIHLDAGTIKSVSYTPGSGKVTITLDAAGEFSPKAYVNIETTDKAERIADYTVDGIPLSANKKSVINLLDKPTNITIEKKKG